MPLTLKQENFCLAYIETGNASEAYRRAYDAERMKPESINRKAKEMMDNGKISARIAAARNAITERHKLTVDDLIDELDEARTIALAALIPQSSSAISATMGKAKLLGFAPDKDGGSTNYTQININTSALTTDEVRRLANQPLA